MKKYIIHLFFCKKQSPSISCLILQYRGLHKNKLSWHPEEFSRMTIDEQNKRHLRRLYCFSEIFLIESYHMSGWGSRCRDWTWTPQTSQQDSCVGDTCWLHILNKHNSCRFSLCTYVFFSTSRWRMCLLSHHTGRRGSIGL